MIAQKFFNPLPKGQYREMLLNTLKISQKNMDYKLHPWMQTELREYILELDSEMKREKTVSHGKNKTGLRKKEV